MIHLYSKTTTSTQIQEVTDAFGLCEHIDIDKTTTLKDDDVYLVEIGKTEKSVLLNIKQLLSNKKETLIYFFTSDSHSLILFQLGIVLNVKNIFTKKHDTPKIISTIEKELSLLKTTQLNQNIVKSLVDDYYFMIFDSKELKFASQKIYEDFDCRSLDDIKSKICSQFDLQELLNNDISLKNNFTFTTNK